MRGFGERIAQGSIEKAPTKGLSLFQNVQLLAIPRHYTLLHHLPLAQGSSTGTLKGTSDL